MKKVILFLSILFIALCNVFAQNAHWSYGLSSGTSASSAATVVRSNGTAYIAQTQTGTNTIHLSEILPMNPVVNLITSHYNECPDAVYCAKSSELTNYEETKSCVISEGNRARIEEYAGTFVCFGFSGAVEYEILDVTGKRICFGKTVNEKPNPINLNQYGLYLLRCIDETGNYCVRKINRK